MIFLTKNLSKFVIFSGFFMIFISCSIPEIKKEAPEVNFVKKGEKFRIVLPEDHTKGYTWQLNTDYEQDKLENINTVWRGNEKGVSFNFMGHKPGNVNLTFISRKYRDTADVKTFIITILAE